MSVGLGIFLSVLLISIIYLFQRFPDSKKWKKFVKIFFWVAMVVIVLPGSIIILAVVWDGYVKRKIDKPKQIIEYWGISLGEVLADVRFRKGLPKEEFELDISSLSNFDIGKVTIINGNDYYKSVALEQLSSILHNQKYKISPESLIRINSKGTFKAWEYKDSYDKGKYFIRFTEAGIVGAISCTGDSSYSCPRVASFGINSTWDEMIKTFGDPPYGYTDFNDGKRAVCYPKYNLCFTLEKSEVHFITIKSWKASDYYYLGKAIFNTWNKDNYTYAIKAFDQAIELDPKYVKAYMNKGLVLYQLNKYDEAINLYHLATTFGHRTANLYNILGLALKASNKHQEAINAFDKALELDSNYTAAYFNKARLLSVEEKYEEAIIMIDKAIELDKTDLSYFLSYKGRYLSKLSKYEEAIKIYNDSISAEPFPFNNSYTYYERGLALLALGKRKQAIESINKALELNPGYKKFQKTLDELDN